MGITVADCLKLPSLRDAKVIAGQRGLWKDVSAVTVLEYAKVFAMADELFLGNELIISAFTSIADNVEAQCDAIVRLHKVGETALVLYYTDIFLKGIDVRLIETADKLDFPLLMMPPSAYNLRYSEVITEVLERLFEDRKKEERIVPSLIKRIGNMRERQRNISSILRILSDRLRNSLLLLDRNGRELGIATWPMYISDELVNVFRDTADDNACFPMRFDSNGKRLEIQRKIFHTDSQKGLRLYIMDEPDNINSDFLEQAIEVLQTSYGLWQTSLQKEEADDLIRIILNANNNDVYQVAKRLNIDLKILRTMWVLHPKQSISSSCEDTSLVQKQILKDFLFSNRKTAIVDAFDRGVVAFMRDADHLDIDDGLAHEFMKGFSKECPDTLLIWCGGLDTIFDAKKAYILIEEHCDTARTIYPLRDILTLHELTFAETCYNIVHSGTTERERCLAILKPLEGQRDLEKYLETLTAYLIDANQNTADAAALLGVHESTVKYRINKISSLTGCDILRLPTTYNLYTALAVKRLLVKD